MSKINADRVNLKLFHFYIKFHFSIIKCQYIYNPFWYLTLLIFQEMKYFLEGNIYLLYNNLIQQFTISIGSKPYYLISRRPYNQIQITTWLEQSYWDFNFKIYQNSVSTKFQTNFFLAHVLFFDSSILGNFRRVLAFLFQNFKKVSNQ